jgi:hypothetical protein
VAAKKKSEISGLETQRSGLPTARVTHYGMMICESICFKE